MRPRPLWILALLWGCAEGEPIGDPADALELGAEPPPIASEVLVDVAAPDGSPLLADAVWISVAPDDNAPARCMERKCETWIASVTADVEATAYAEVCGFLYLAPVTMTAATVHVTVTADDSACAPERVPD
jgi:hypothetical protein